MSQWLSQSISSAFHKLGGSQAAPRLEDELMPDSDLSFADKPPRPKHKNGSARSERSNRSSTSHAGSSHSADTSQVTPEQARPSPRTRASLGNSAILHGILESHPSFSVFRKSTSLQSLDSLASSGSNEYARAQSSFSNQASPSKTPPSAKRHLEDADDDFVPSSSPPHHPHPDASDEWHLSSVEEMESLNWGDRSGDTEAGAAGDDSNASADNNNQLASTARADASSVRLVHYDSPPSRRQSTSKSPRPSTQVQFSPLSLTPSPLIGVPRPPPPPPAHDEDDDSPSSRAIVRTILKLPRTPGTGLSVRFSSSTTRETTPPSLARFADAGELVDVEEGDEPSMDEHGNSSNSSSGESSKAVASFLSKLQAAIPSPETSLVEHADADADPDASTHSTNLLPLGPNPLLLVSSPTAAEFDSTTDQGIGLGRPGRPPMFAEDVSDLFDTSAPHFSRLQSVEDWSVADAIEETIEEQDEPPEEETRKVATPVQVESPHTSFYRQFLKKRAGNSQIAADELGRLIEREGERTPSPRAPERATIASTYTTPVAPYVQTSPGSLKRSAREMDGEDESPAPATGSKSVYYSPALSEEAEVDSSAEQVEASLLSELGGERPFVPMHPAPDDQPDIQGGYAPCLSLPAIYEESEPNTTVDSISFMQSPPTTVPFGSNPRRRSTSHPLSPPETDLAVFQSTPAPPPRHRRSQSEVCAPSPNPFATQGGSPDDGLDLIHQLISAQGDQLANGSSQRFLLSSLITNLRDEIERKDRVLRSLQQEKEEAEAFSQVAFKEAAEWERAARHGALASDPSRAKLEALEDLVERLTDELETRTALDDRNRQKLEDEAAIARVDLQAARSDVRDGEIRLRHARASQAEAEAMRSRVERERDELSEHLATTLEDAQQFQRERDDLRARLRRELEDRDETILNLRAELAERPEAGSGHHPEVSDAEVERRVEEARTAALREAAVVRADLEAQVQHAHAQAEAVAELRHQNRVLREEIALAKEAERQQHSEAELARLEARTEVGRLRVELSEANRARKALSEDLEELHGRIEAVQADKDRQLEAVQRELEKHRTAWQESRGAQDELLNSIAIIEADAAKSHVALQTAHGDLEALRRETNALLDDRDRRLTESQTALASKRAKMDSLVEECTRLKELVGALRRGSSERDDKISRLQKAKAELQEDVMGLNIALESKQQEAALWKRQAATANAAVSRIPTTSQRSRSALGSSGASNSSRISYQAPPHNDTPIKARPRPKLAFGSSAVRRPLDTAETPSKENLLFHI
ncbi:hypothetical protein RQP46_009356 [Phenoliferia psychrophenolica]